MWLFIAKSCESGVGLFTVQCSCAVILVTISSAVATEHLPTDELLCQNKCCRRVLRWPGCGQHDSNSIPSLIIIHARRWLMFLSEHHSRRVVPPCTLYSRPTSLPQPVAPQHTHLSLFSSESAG